MPIIAAYYIDTTNVTPARAKTIAQAEKIIDQCVVAAYKDVVKLLTKGTPLDNMSTASHALLGHYEILIDQNATSAPLLAAKIGTAICEEVYAYLNGHGSALVSQMAVESTAPVPAIGLMTDFSKGKTRPDVRLGFNDGSPYEAIFDVTASASANHTQGRGWQKHKNVIYCSEITYASIDTVEFL